MIKIQDYLKHEKKLYVPLLKYMDSDENIDKAFNELVIILKKRNFGEDKYESREMLLLLIKICQNHHRKPYFLAKIEKILLYLEDRIKEIFSNLEIFKIFRKNKRILLLLFKLKFITVDESIVKTIHFLKYDFFFYPEIRSYLNEEKRKSIESKMLKIDEHAFDDFETKRQEGENDSYVCQLIRKDSIEKFVSFINQTNYSISSTIKPSIFETNSFLIYKEPTLIEYAAFFGSIQIFQYLKMNSKIEKKIQIEPTLWLYAIHGRNMDIIHQIEEEDNSHKDEKIYELFIKESIKCHHNKIATYFKENYLNDLYGIDLIMNKYGYEYHNFQFIIDKFEVKFAPFLFEFDYIPIVEIAVKEWNIKSTNKVIQNFFDL